MQCLIHENISSPIHFWDIMLSLVFDPISQWWRITEKILVVRSGSSPKSNHFVLVTHPTCPPSFIWIHSQLFEISCTQTNKQTNRQWLKHNLPPLVARYLRKLWTDSDYTWWTGWVCDGELLQFWWRSESGSGYENYLISKVILHHWEIGPKTIYSTISQKCIGPDMFSWIRHDVAEVCALPSAFLIQTRNGELD